MEAVAQVLASGLLAGLQYALAALGLALILRVARVLNLAHGAFFALGAYLAYQASLWKVPQLADAVLAAAAGFAAGVLVDRALVRPVRANAFTAALVLLGAGITAEEAFTLVWGASYYSVPFRLKPLLFAHIVVDGQQIAAGGMAALTVGALAWFFRTRPGLAFRTAVADPEIASLCGLDVPRVQTVTFGIAGAMAAGAGALLSPLLILNPTVGRIPLVLSVAAVLIGGPGRIWWTLLASLALGVATIATSTYLTSSAPYLLGIAVIVAAAAWRTTTRQGADLG